MSSSFITSGSGHIHLYILSFATGYREQPNSITHFLDCSNIYGPNVEKQKELRIGGKNVESLFLLC